MACHHLLKKDIVTLCKKRGLSVGKFTKAELIVQLEEDDRSKEQIPDPNWGYSRIWEQLKREPGIAKTPVPDQTRVFTIGFPIGGSRRTGLELSLREQEDPGRQREPEKELQKQQQHELAVGERRGLGDLPGGLPDSRLPGRAASAHRPIAKIGSARRQSPNPQGLSPIPGALARRTGRGFLGFLLFLNKHFLMSQHLGLCFRSPDICSLPTEVGPCTAAIPRWVYNWHSKKREEFSYGGCNGNKNNFETKEDCLQACAGQGSP
ncbi:kunitz-type protease inhibitor 4 isoform X2 [Caretta caretta]|uniref:kunitz-type protease inhibitor 4 isoform X2 n=1 Tax=Caretta caretta TaxID=8467 RepID=UPI003F4B7A39